MIGLISHITESNMQVISAQGNRYNVFVGTYVPQEKHITVIKSSMRSFFSHSLTESGDRERIVVRLALHALIIVILVAFFVVSLMHSYVTAVV